MESKILCDHVTGFLSILMHLVMQASHHSPDQCILMMNVTSTRQTSTMESRVCIKLVNESHNLSSIHDDVIAAELTL